MKSEEDFKRATGAEPTKDDMERVNCNRVGNPGHWSCGWCDECDKPRFVCGHYVTRSES